MVSQTSLSNTNIQIDPNCVFQLCFADAFHFNRNKTRAKLTEHSLLFFRLQCMASRHWVVFEFFQFANTPAYVKLSLWFRCRLLHNMFRVWKNVAENKYSVSKGGTWCRALDGDPSLPKVALQAGLSGSSLFSLLYHSLYYLLLTSFSHLDNINNSFLFYMWQIKSLTAGWLICLKAFARELAYQGNILLL